MIVEPFFLYHSKCPYAYGAKKAEPRAEPFTSISTIVVAYFDYRHRNGFKIVEPDLLSYVGIVMFLYKVIYQSAHLNHKIVPARTFEV